MWNHRVGEYKWLKVFKIAHAIMHNMEGLKGEKKNKIGGWFFLKRSKNLGVHNLAMPQRVRCVDQFIITRVMSFSIKNIYFF